MSNPAAQPVSGSFVLISSVCLSIYMVVSNIFTIPIYDSRGERRQERLGGSRKLEEFVAAHKLVF